MPETHVAPARHGLEILLTGLGFDPQWTDRSGLPAGGMYYGSDPESVRGDCVRMRMDPAWPAGVPLDPARVSRLEWDGGAWPLLHPVGRTFGAPAGGVDDADVVASTHAWTSGLLEAHIEARDIHGRLRDDDAPPATLAAARPDLLDATLRPPVDAYRLWLGDALARAGASPPGRNWDGHAWAVAPTVDIDIVRTRRPTRWPGPDPRRRHLAELTEQFTGDGMRSTFFIKAGATSRYDVPYGLDHKALDPVWAAARGGLVEIGLHPSYFVHDHPGRLERERTRLGAAAERNRVRVGRFVRTHFLRWIEPGTPRALAGAGFAADSSLGFAGRVGFRRGTSLPFRLFDLSAGRALDLWEVPLCAMDTALFVHGGHRHTDALTAVEAALAGAAGAGGVAVLLWHNEPLGGGHLEVLAEALRGARAGGALVDGLSGALDRWRVS